MLEPGTKLGHYEVFASIGAGGMGEVYRARDTKLNRDVAIKVLPEEFARDKERLNRFEREARLLAQLNHTNIATLHGLEEHDGQQFLVMELVEGETLAERIAKRPLPVDEAIPLFIQIAEGLEAAHEKGIIHRDLKPANIKIERDGKPKILDFGLAKAFGEEQPVASSSESPTVTKGTIAGVILGTAPYMSPEQARGKAVDKRADIWSFGCCLYEALTGKTAFAGETVSDTIGKILERDPDWQALSDRIPASIERVLRRCLRKDPTRRLHDIADARIEMEEATAAPIRVAPHGRSRKTALFATVTAISVAIAAWSLTRSSPRQVTRTSIPLPPGHELFVHWTSDLAISPDGQKVAYLAATGDSRQLFLRATDQLDSDLIADTVGARMPFFSPDSQWLAFWVGEKLMRVAVSGGAPQTIGQVSRNIRGACWMTGGDIVFNTDSGLGLSRIAAEGGPVETLTTPDKGRGEKTHRFPQPLPGGTKVLFTIASSDIDSFDDASIAVLSLDTAEYRVVLEGGTHARYSPSGHLIYARAGSLFAVPFDPHQAQVSGSPVRVLEEVSFSSNQGSAQFDVSRDGSLLYARGTTWGNDYRVVWADREGRVKPLIDTTRAFDAVSLSPDGHLLALYIEGANGNVWVHDIARDTSTRLTFHFDSFDPVWTPDGRRLTFASSRTNPSSVFWQAADGSGDAEQLVTGEDFQTPTSWSPDGTTLAFVERDATTGADINVLSMDGERNSRAFLQTSFNEDRPVFSPDGRWIAYISNESGQYEVYLRPFPSADGKRQVSTDGGLQPIWNPNGKELFYLNDGKMMAVDVKTDGNLVLGEPRILFEKAIGPDPPSSRNRAAYDVTPDGQRFVMIVPTESKPRATDLILVQNWIEELERLVPTE